MYFVIANRLLKEFDNVAFRHIPRVENQEANDLAQLASGYKVSKEKLEEAIEIRGRVISTKLSPSDLESIRLGYGDEENFEILNIDDPGIEDWRKPIKDYLQYPNQKAERKIKYRALSYVLFGNKLFKKTAEGVLLKCLGEDEAYIALSNVHSGACGAHQAGSKNSSRIIVNIIVIALPNRNGIKVITKKASKG
ncbi:uncharacterized protein LOC127078657 [Lathyrus oleraceus]|uniref:uncharacterized protein LOC127078657 n=1 Tax=Pisum sativum TaxID=3888 RepID=UPI0021CE6E5B|nr:uncharacterized protein LOC127078657 [Pisum sativum]